MSFWIQDNALTSTRIGGIACYRDGADSTGAMAFYTGVSGVSEFLRKDSTGITLTGQTTISNGDLTLQQAGITDFTIYNTTGGDTDGARGTDIIFKGKTSSGTAHNLAEIWGVHDGSAADQKGRIEFYTNDDSAVGNKFMLFDSANNLLLGTWSIGTNADTVIGIANGTAPTSSPTNMVQLYAKDVSASSELFVRDESGTETQLSPHDPITGEWVFFSKNKEGKIIKIQMERLMRLLNEKFGGGFIEEWIEGEAA
jgi:hypothetical protein